MIVAWFAAMLACTGEGPTQPVAPPGDSDSGSSDTDPDPETSTWLHTGDSGGSGEVCGPDALTLADQYFCAPDFTLPDHTGADVTLSDLRGQVVIVDVVAMWCTPCKVVAQEVFQSLYASHHDRGLEVITIVSEDVFGGDPTVVHAGEWKGDLNLDFVVTADVDGAVSPTWDRGGVVPMSYVIDQHGMITWFANGSGTLEQFTREVDALLE